METYMNKFHLALAAGLPALVLSVAAPAADEQYKTEKQRLEAEFKAAKLNCKALTGADRRECMKTAKAEHEAAEKQLKASRSASR
jgi:isopentenyl diphosphate isomerase/L-lactate dehydrogenase-like FMN-dependent dehydrogenase